LAKSFTALVATLLNGSVFPAARAQSRSSGCRLWGFVFLLLAACGGPTQVRLVLRVEDDRFRPDYVDVVWGVPDGPQRRARIPGQGNLPASGPEIGTVLITLADSQMQARRFVARGFRGEGMRVSGASGLLPWKGGAESTLTLTLVDCYDDPSEPRLPGCPATTTDGGVEGDGGSATPDGGRDTAPADVRPSDAADGPRG
jgi:hypothetical protein